MSHTAPGCWGAHPTDPHQSGMGSQGIKSLRLLLGTRDWGAHLTLLGPLPTWHICLKLCPPKIQGGTVPHTIHTP